MLIKFKYNNEKEFYFHILICNQKHKILVWNSNHLNFRVCEFLNTKNNWLIYKGHVTYCFIALEICFKIIHQFINYIKMKKAFNMLHISFNAIIIFLLKIIIRNKPKIRPKKYLC